jgi:alanine racemase
MFMVDVTHIPNVEVGTVATLLGADGEEQITAEQLAGWMGTINYEVVARIHPSQPRFLVPDRVPDAALELPQKPQVTVV